MQMSCSNPYSLFVQNLDSNNLLRVGWILVGYRERCSLLDMSGFLVLHVINIEKLVTFDKVKVLDNMSIFLISLVRGLP